MSRRRRRSGSGSGSGSGPGNQPGPQSQNQQGQRQQQNQAKAAAAADAFWGDAADAAEGGEAEQAPGAVERIRPSLDPGALPRSLGDPPLTPDTAAAHHVAVVYEEAVRAATALAAANGLLDTED